MSVKSVFDATAATYDPARRKLIPCFDHFYAAAIELIPTDAIQVTDLGAGTGLFSAFLRQQLPAAHLHLIDISEPMLMQARTRLADDANVTTEVADYTFAPLPPSQDVIASALSIHHLQHTAKEQLFAASCTHSAPAACSSTRTRLPARHPRSKPYTSGGG